MRSKEFGQYLKALRESRGMTLLDVEKEARISNGYLSQIESGARGIPHFDTLKKLAATYKVPVAEMVKNSELAAEGKDTLAEDDFQFLSRGFQKLSDEDKQQMRTMLRFFLDQKRKHRKVAQDK